jgi:ABC-type uncharacterized transport system substrate-binding protein
VVSASPAYNKRWELLALVLPRVRRIGVLLNEQYFAEIKRQLPTIVGDGVQVVFIDWRRDMSYQILGQIMRNQRIDAVDLGLGVIRPENIAEFLQWERLQKIPSMHYAAHYAEKGGLLSYESMPLDRAETLAAYVIEIVHGSNAGDLPIRYPNKFVASLNVTTAKALAIKIPPYVLRRIDNWID